MMKTMMLMKTIISPNKEEHHDDEKQKQKQGILYTTAAEAAAEAGSSETNSSKRMLPLLGESERESDRSNPSKSESEIITDDGFVVTHRSSSKKQRTIRERAVAVAVAVAGDDVTIPSLLPYVAKSKRIHIW
jgi:hypothetical protein